MFFQEITEYLHLLECNLYVTQKKSAQRRGFLHTHPISISYINFLSQIYAISKIPDKVLFEV